MQALAASCEPVFAMTGKDPKAGMNSTAVPIAGGRLGIKKLETYCVLIHLFLKVSVT